MRCSSGNVLFLILLAVALFAALSYAVTQSSRSGGKDISDEQAALFASEIIQYATSVKTAVDRIRFLDISPRVNCSANDLGSSGDCSVNLSFESDAWSNTYLSAGYDPDTNADPEPASRGIFHPDGGGVSFKNPDESWLDTDFASDSDYMNYGHYVYTGVNAIANVGDPNKNDVLMLLPYLRQSVCMEINDQLGIDNPSGDAPTQGANGFHTQPFNTGVWRWSGQPNNRITVAQLSGQLSGCARVQNFYDYSTSKTSISPAYVYVFFHVLLAR